MYGLHTLQEVIRYLEGKWKPSKEEKIPEFKTEGTDELDFLDVRGQEELLDAIVLGAAGGHNV